MKTKFQERIFPCSPSKKFEIQKRACFCWEPLLGPGIKSKLEWDRNNGDQELVWKSWNLKKEPNHQKLKKPRKLEPKGTNPWNGNQETNYPQ